jgi:flagellar hook-basal body complex protein FliE
MPHEVDLFSLLPKPISKDRKRPPVKSPQSELFSTFSSCLKEALSKANDMRLEARDIQKRFVAGDVDNIHDVMIASEKAGLALQLVLEVRNKAMRAYDEIMRMR